MCWFVFFETDRHKKCIKALTEIERYQELRLFMKMWWTHLITLKALKQIFYLIYRSCLNSTPLLGQQNHKSKINVSKVDMLGYFLLL